MSEIVASAQSHRQVIVAPKFTCLTKLIEHPIRTSASHATIRTPNGNATLATNKASGQLNRKETRVLLSVCELSPDSQVIKPRHAQPTPNLPRSNITLVVNTPSAPRNETKENSPTPTQDAPPPPRHPPGPHRHRLRRKGLHARPPHGPRHHASHQQVLRLH